MYYHHDPLLDWWRVVDLPSCWCIPAWRVPGSGQRSCRSLKHHAMSGQSTCSVYGDTRARSGFRSPSLDDFAKLVADVVPPATAKVSLIGHSLGGAIAMRAAAQHLRGRADKLVLIEPSPFSLLDAHGR